MMKKNILFFVFLFFVIFVSKNVFAQNTVKTKVGEPKGATGGWPTTGTITQGPLGAYDHGPLHLNAIDIGGGNSTPPVYSPYDGTVFEVHDCTRDGDCSRGWGGYGNSVVIKLPDGGSALFGHLSVILVSAGQSIYKGDQIGIMGTTGVSTGNHLHFELRGLPMAPPYIPEDVTPLNCDTPSIPCSPSSI